MSWKINEQEYTSVTHLDVQKRYAYFVKKVADWEEIWSLKGDSGWILVGDSGGREAVPVWPHARYAEAYAVKNGGGQPESIGLPIWRERWVPGLLQEGRWIAVFPTPGNQGALCDPSVVQNDIDQEVARLE